jgi:small-conductance mechanosensitive channel
MTFVGKILVILIMAFSLVFLGVSTVVFTTATNWKTVTEKQKQDLQKLQTKFAGATEQAKDAEIKLDTAGKAHAKAVAEQEARIADLSKQIATAEEETKRAQTSLETAQANAKTALDDAAARKGQIEVLTATIEKAQTQANQFSAQNIELTDRIRILEREKATAEQNAKDLRSSNAKYTGLMKKMGVPPEKLDQFDPSTVAPDVEGKVSSLNRTGRSLELSIGSDDGLAAGQELYVFRVQPRAEYIGKVKVVSVYPDKAVAEVIGRTVNGKKILEGDIVSSTFNAR